MSTVKMAARIIAQVIMQFTAVASRAFVSAYQQALQNAKAGGGANAAANLGSVLKNKMLTDEALKVLHIERSALSTAVLDQQYKKFFESNDPKKGGSFYLQSKVFRAKEALDRELNPPAAPTKDAEAAASVKSTEAGPTAGAGAGAGAGGESEEARIRRERFERFSRGKR